MKHNIFTNNALILIVVLLCSCIKHLYTKTNINKMDDPTQPNKAANLLVSEGVDYFAEGTIPTIWQLKINFADTVRFKADDGLAITFAANQMVKQTVENGTKYTLTLKAGKIIINTTNKACANNEKKGTTESTFSFNSSTYKGCGGYVSNEALSGKWLLDKMMNATIQENDFEKIPYIEINLESNLLNGMDGCNFFNTSIEVLGKQIKFGNVASTKKYCNKKDISLLLMKGINNQLVGYYFKNKKLYFYLNDDSELIFKREIN